MTDRNSKIRGWVTAVALGLSLVAVAASLAGFLNMRHRFQKLETRFYELSDLAVKRMDEVNAAELTPSEAELALDIAGQARIQSLGDIDARRAALIGAIFAKTDPATLQPSSVEAVDPLPFFSGVEIAGAERLISTMRYGLQSTAYLLKSSSGRRCLAIFHHGHENYLDGSRYAHESLLKAGCDVLSVSMPLLGPFNGPAEVSLPGHGPMVFQDHNTIAMLEEPDFPALRYYFEPVFAFLNHLLQSKQYDRVGMIGFSGGAWTALAQAAMDPRIDRSYPLSGFLPEAIRSRSQCKTDFEAFAPGLYRAASSAEQYLMAADRPGRRMISINYREDRCASGEKISIFAEDIGRMADQLSLGEPGFLIVEEAGHELSRPAIDFVVHDLMDPSPRAFPRAANLD